MQSFAQTFASYDDAIEVLGLSNLAHLIPFTPEQIIQALRDGDEHLNSLPISEWDRASGFIFTRTDDDEQVHRVPSGLTHLFKQHNIDAYSCSQCVSLLKRAAKQLYGKE